MLFRFLGSTLKREHYVYKSLQQSLLFLRSIDQRKVSMLNHKDTKIKLQQKCLQQNNPIYLWCYPQIYIHKPEKEVSSLKALPVHIQAGDWLTGKPKFHGVYRQQPDHSILQYLHFAIRVALSLPSPFPLPPLPSFPYLFYDSVSNLFPLVQYQMDWMNITTKVDLGKMCREGPLVQAFVKFLKGSTVTQRFED